MKQPTLVLTAPNEPEPAEATARPFNGLVKSEILKPLEIPGLARAEFSLTRNPDPRSRVRSLILTGAPRTGKSSAVTAVAEYLGWPLLILDPSDFAKEGLLMMPTVATTIFDDLSELDDSVIFFDEMEELMRTREGPEGQYEQRLLTTSLLPKLQALRDKARCIFIVATNFFNLLDSAAAAQGRFDLRLKLTAREPTDGTSEVVSGASTGTEVQGGAK